MVATSSGAVAPAALYRTLWRWHFYAGLFVLPFLLILSVTGAVYLFKPQIQAWEESSWMGLSGEGAVSADRQRDAALAAYPGARFGGYRLPERTGDAALIRLVLADGGAREVFVSPQGRVLGALDPDARIAAVVADIHGSLLIGTWGDRLVELVASWTIVMILTGLYLWWPHPFRAAGTFWPRLRLRGRVLLKDIHRVTGFWVAGLVLILIVTGLPWAGVWGSAFKWVRSEMGWVQGQQQWKVGAGDHDHAAHEGAPQVPSAAPASTDTPLKLSDVVARARWEDLPHPVIVLPPHAPQALGPPTGNVWTAKSETQNQPQARQVSYDPVSGAETERRGFADRHAIDRAVGIGISWHEGQLFGWVNQLIGLLTALALIGVSVLGAVMWLKRRPSGGMGVPPPGGWSRWMIAAIGALALLLPMFGASLIVLVLIERIAALTRRVLPSPG